MWQFSGSLVSLSGELSKLRVVCGTLQICTWNQKWGLAYVNWALSHLRCATFCKTRQSQETQDCIWGLKQNSSPWERKTASLSPLPAWCHKFFPSHHLFPESPTALPWLWEVTWALNRSQRSSTREDQARGVLPRSGSPKSHGVSGSFTTPQSSLPAPFQIGSNITFPVKFP